MGGLGKTFGQTSGLNSLGEVVGGFSGSLGEAAGAVSNFQAGLDSSTLAQQQAFVQALQNQMAGNGPSVAQNQLNQATGTNVSNAMAMAAAQRGVNPALAARQAQQAGAMANQQAAGQAATLRAQEQLNAQGQLGNQLNTQQNQYLQTQGINANTAAVNAQTQGKIVGGVLEGLGSAGSAAAGGMYKGGTVGYADGGSVQPQSSITNYFMNPMLASSGNTVPGTPIVPGNSPVNDVVPAMLSPKEIVIPNSITQGENAGQRAKEFVEAELAKSKKKDSNGYARGGVVRADAPDIPAEGFLGQAVQDEIRMAKNYRASQPPSPLIDQPTDNQFAVDLNKVNDAVPEAKQETPAEVVNQTPTVQQPTQSAGLGTGLDGDTTQMASMLKGMNEQKAGLQMEAAATGAAGKEQAAVYDQQAQEMAQRQANYDKQMQELTAKRQALMTDLEGQKINPNQYYANLSTGGKISTLIGIVLGGIGAGMSGRGGNMALDTYNKLVSADIESQKANVDNKKSLLSANMQEMGNLRDAEQMTRAMMNDATANKIKQSIANSQDPIAKARAQQMIGALDQQNAKIMGELASKRAVSQALSQGQKINRENLSEDQRQRYVDSGPFSGLASSKEEAVKFREQLPAYNSTVNGLKRLIEMSKDGGTTVTPAKIAEAEQIKYLLAGTLREDVLGPGTVNEGERKIMLEKILADPSKIFSMDSANKTKLVNLLNNIEAKKSDQARTIGLNASGPSSGGNVQMSPMDKRIYDMARQNPNSKNAQEAMKILKAKYGN